MCALLFMAALFIMAKTNSDVLPFNGETICDIAIQQKTGMQKQQTRKSRLFNKHNLDESQRHYAE